MEPRLTVPSQRRRVPSEVNENQDRCLAQNRATTLTRCNRVLLLSLEQGTSLARKIIHRRNQPLQHNLRPVHSLLPKEIARDSSLLREAQLLVATRRMDSGSLKRRKERPQVRWQLQVDRPKHPQRQVKERRKDCSPQDRERRRLHFHLLLRSLILSHSTKMLENLGSQDSQGSQDNLDSQSPKRRRESCKQ